jgi:hypothetical protein
MEVSDQPYNLGEKYTLNRGWVDPRAGVDTLQRRKTLLFLLRIILI